MPATKLLPGVPPAAAALGLAGVLPFAATALASLAAAPWGDLALLALLAYGAVILSFLGGIEWGLASARDRPS